MRRARLLVAAVLLALAAACLAAPAALGATTGLSASAVAAAAAVPVHAALASTQPADGSVVSRAPQQVTASFDQTVGITADSLVVYSPSGQRVDDGQTVHVTAFEISVGLLNGLGNGTYTAVWHVISADTHPVDGAFTFSVGAPSATHVGALLPPSDPLVNDLFAVVRWLEYLCYSLLGGGVAFLIICWPEGGGRRGTGRLIAASGIGLLLSTLLGLLLQGPYGAGAGLSQVFSSTLVRTTLQGNLGPASEARELMSLLAVGAAAYMFPRLPAASARARRAYGVLWLALITAIAASWAVYDHASTGIQAPWGIPDDIIHLDAVALWIGGLAMLVRFTLRLPAAHGKPDADLVTGAAVTRVVMTPEAARAVRRFSPIALGCVGAIVASGVYQTWREVGTWGALLHTTYGRLVLAKVAGLLILIALGYVARVFIRRGSADKELVPTLRRLRRSVAAELVTAVVILALTALLVNTATGRESYAPPVSAGQAFDTGGPGGTGTVHLFVTPARLGPNTIQLYFTGTSGKAFVPAQVSAALYFPAKDLGPLPVTLTRTAPGQYRTQDATVTFTGQWTLQLIVRSDAFDETSVTFPLVIH
jgi:copper transport protein